jgi:hypothetical protein
MMAAGKERERRAAASKERTPERTPEQIQAEIDQGRRELGDTVAAVADKADVKKQARRKAAGAKARAQAKKNEVVGKAAAAKDQAAANPLGAGGAFAAGLLIGFIIGRR